MTKIHYLYFGNGFRLIGDDTLDRDKVHQVDEEVVALYKEWINCGRGRPTWDYISRLIQSLKNHIPDINRFIYNQRYNKRLTGHNYNVLHELVKFINTGRHDLSPKSAMNLLEYSSWRPDEGISRGKLAKDRIVNRVEGVMGTEYISRWLTQDNAVEDIVCTMYILFGNTEELLFA